MRNKTIRSTLVILHLASVLLFASLSYGDSGLIGAIPDRQQWSLNGKWRTIVDRYEGGSFGFRPVWDDAGTKNPSDRIAKL